MDDTDPAGRLREALTYWSEMTGCEIDGDEAAEVIELVRENPDADHVLRVAGELFADEPFSKAIGSDVDFERRAMDLGEVDYVEVVLALREHGVFTADTTAAELRTKLLLHTVSASDAALAAHSLLPFGAWAPTLPTRGALSENLIEEVRVWALNTAPVIEMIPWTNGFVLFTHNA